MTAPLDTRTMKRVGGALGSNPAGVFEDAEGRRYYVKTLESAVHARNEWLAAQLYRLAGAPTLTYVPTVAPDQIATKLLTLDTRHAAHFNKAERRQAQHWLGVHAWTANWDAVGQQGDNQGVADGQVLTLDVGGALAYRAQGDPKGAAFGDHVGEIDRLRTDAGNPHAVRLFSDMSADEVRRAIEVVTAIPEARIRQVVLAHGGSQALAARMVARQADLASRLVALTPVTRS